MANRKWNTRGTELVQDQNLGSEVDPQPPVQAVLGLGLPEASFRS